MKTTETTNSNLQKLNFELHLLDTLKSNRFNFYNDNYDTFFRGPVPLSQPSGIRGVIPSIIRKTKKSFHGDSFRPALRNILNKLAAFLKNYFTYRFLPKLHFRNTLAQYKKFEFLYQKLSDDISRELLISLLAYRALGFRKIKLQRNNPAYWNSIEAAHKLDMGLPAVQTPFVTWPLLCFDLKSLGYDMRLYTYAQAVAINFVNKQYMLKRGNVICKAEQGDIVIDAGGCWGDTALQFACDIGPDGQVFTFEFVPNNMKIMRKNIELNPHLAPRITVVENPVGARTGEKIFYLENGPGSRVTNTKVDTRYVECTVFSIDQLTQEQKLEKVDFIKMDVEGSELDALKGSELTIKKFKPKLAICIYHKPDDYLVIPKYIDDMQLGYRFYIEHHTIYLNETVLFAVPDSRI